MAEKLLKNRYLIEDVDRDELGAGAFGTTYLAIDTNYKSEPKVVVKQLKPDYSRCRSVKQREYLLEVALKFFRREAEVLEKLGRMSNQIPTLLDNFTELSATKENEFYIVQEWIDGEPLGKLLTSGVRLTQQKSIELMIEILQPLVFCHQEGAIHRDLKPDNLMRRREDKKLVIIDFGAVREVGQLTIMPNGQPRTGSIIGTPGYMPLEQMHGSPVLASDVYAVGAIGMQAMTGMYPHEIQLGATGVPDWQKIQNCYATPEFAAVLNQMLAVLHNTRYFDAATALAALRSLSVSAAKPTTPVTTKPSVVVLPRFEGKLSQEMFTFETAKLERVSVQKVEIIKKPGWLGIGEKEERQTKTVQEWQVKKSKAKAESFTEDLENGINLEMVYVPAGSFTMGSDESDSEKPRHVVTVPSFYMGRYQVTQEQYLMIMGKNPAKWQDAKLPVEQVSWKDAQVFCQKLSDKTGKKYRLPSEAEWEYACRAKTDTPFYFGETISTEVANYDGNYTYKSGVKGIYREKTTAVGSFPANGFGLHDMHGNVWEWCEDKWHENYQGAPTDGSAWINGNDNDYRLLRGGSWDFNPSDCRSAVRYGRSADRRDSDIGFRIICAQDL